MPWYPALADDAKSDSTIDSKTDPKAGSKADSKPAAPSVTDIAASVDPAKKAAIKELLTLTRLSESYGAISNILLNQMRRSVAGFMQKAIGDDSRLSAEQKKRMLDTFSDSSDRVINRYRELSAERINMPVIMEQVAYKVYDESFSTSEIQDLITFYRTPTGQKALKEMPEIMHRSMVFSAQLIQSKVVDIAKEVAAEEFVRLKTELGSQTPAAKPADQSGTGVPTTSAGSASTAPATSAVSPAATPTASDTGNAGKDTQSAPSK